MNFFFDIQSKIFSCNLKIPKFRNDKKYSKKYYIYSFEVKNKVWIHKLEDFINEDDFFFYLNRDVLNNNKIFCLSNEIEIEEKFINKTKLPYLNNFTQSSPSYRSNLRLNIDEGGFSQYQSDYPHHMIEKKGNILSPMGILLNKNADSNFIFFKNIFKEPIYDNFSGYFVDLQKKKVLKKFSLLTNKTNEIFIDKSFIAENIYFFTDNYLGIPLYVSIKDKKISLEHTHPPHEYILSPNKFKIIQIMKRNVQSIVSSKII